MTAAHLGILLASLLGFAALALATERYSEHLLRRVPAPRWRLLARTAGWLLLALALALAIAVMDTGVGITLWLGWLSIAALALVFAFPKWPWQPPARKSPAARPRPPKAGAAVLPASRHGVRWVAAAFLVAVPLVYLLAMQATPVQPLLRDDAIDGQVGPWTFRLAETEQRTPKLVAMDIPMKSYHVRFCTGCDAQIRAAYLKVNKPRSMRAAGIVLGGERWDRRVDIQLPANTTAASELWLTVVGKDGATHQAAVPMGRVSPATVAWFASREAAPTAASADAPGAASPPDTAGTSPAPTQKGQ